MPSLNVICCQLNIAWEDKKANYAKVQELVHAAKARAGSLIVLPEMFSTGFSMNVNATADDRDETKEFLSELAKAYDCSVIAGVVNRAGRKAHNQALIFDQRGKETAAYSKVHLFSFAKEDEHYTSGSAPIVTNVGGFKTAPLVCFDLRFPELFREALDIGAELFVVIANWPESRAAHWSTLLQARAIENQAYVVGVNRCGSDPNLSYKGETRIVDPTGAVVMSVGELECVMQAEIDLDNVTSHRRDFPFLHSRQRR